jgi:hypothetical protein
MGNSGCPEVECVSRNDSLAEVNHAGAKLFRSSSPTILEIGGLSARPDQVIDAPSCGPSRSALRIKGYHSYVDNSEPTRLRLSSADALVAIHPWHIFCQRCPPLANEKV